MEKQGERMLDRAIAIGSGFDWITPLKGMVQTYFGDLEGYKVPAGWMNYVDAAAKECNVKLHNRLVVGDDYMFDCRPYEWRRIERYLQRL